MVANEGKGSGRIGIGPGRLRSDEIARHDIEVDGHSFPFAEAGPGDWHQGTGFNVFLGEIVGRRMTCLARADTPARFRDRFAGKNDAQMCVDGLHDGRAGECPDALLPRLGRVGDRMAHLACRSSLRARCCNGSRIDRNCS